jgi:hypothetical protein
MDRSWNPCCNICNHRDCYLGILKVDLELHMKEVIALLVIVAWGAIALAIWDIWRIMTGRKFGVKK